VGYPWVIWDTFITELSLAIPQVIDKDMAALIQPLSTHSVSGMIPPPGNFQTQSLWCVCICVFRLCICVACIISINIEFVYMN